MLRSTPGALSSHLLEERPASLPGQLFVHGGRHTSYFSRVYFSRVYFSTVLFKPEGPRLIPLQNAACVERLMAEHCSIWLRVMGFSDTARIRQMIAPLALPEPLLPPTLEVPQRPRLACLSDALLVVLHRLRFARNPLHLVGSQVVFAVTRKTDHPRVGCTHGVGHDPGVAAHAKGCCRQLRHTIFGTTLNRWLFSSLSAATLPFSMGCIPDAFANSGLLQSCRQCSDG